MKKTKPSNTQMLSAWDKEIPGSILKQQKARQSRRLFLGQSMGLMGGVAVTALVSARVQTKVQENAKSTLAEPWLTLSAVQEHLFPHIDGINDVPSSPGANDINALAYLQVMLDTPDADSAEKKFIIKGVSWLDGIANNLAGRRFVKLDIKNRERVLKTIRKSESGENWLAVLLRYIFEALLTDPVYGGNVDKVGWQWLEHQPGFPRPPANKKYWLLE